MIAVITAVVYVVLAAREKRLCFLFGGISSTFYLYLAFVSQYYLDMMLQIFYIVISVVGFFMWNKSKNSYAISALGVKKTMLLLLASLPVVFLSGYLFKVYLGNDLPYLDASITVLSIVNTFLVIRKKIENWILWFVIDLAAIYLYAYKHFQLTALLYFVYSVLSVTGWLAWRKKQIRV